MAVLGLGALWQVMILLVVVVVVSDYFFKRCHLGLEDVDFAVGLFKELLSLGCLCLGGVYHCVGLLFGFGSNEIKLNYFEIMYKIYSGILN